MGWKEFLKPDWKISLIIILIPYILMFWASPFYWYFAKTMMPEEYVIFISSIIWQSFSTFINSIAPAVIIVSGILLGRKKASVLYLISYLPILIFGVIISIGFVLYPLFFLTPDYPQEYIETRRINELYSLMVKIFNFLITPIFYIWLTTELLRRKTNLIFSILLSIICLNLVGYVLTISLYSVIPIFASIFLYNIIGTIIFTFIWALAIRKGFMKILRKK